MRAADIAVVLSNTLGPSEAKCHVPDLWAHLQARVDPRHAADGTGVTQGMHLSWVVLLAVVSGCFRVAPRAVVRAPTTPEQWLALEQRAAEAAPGDVVLPPTRLAATETFLIRDVGVKANTCYTLALTWQSGLPAYVAVMFVPSSGGPPPNDHVAGRREQLAMSGQTLHFCADHEGTARLNLGALDPKTGAMRVNELLEYVLAVSGRSESAAETVARRADEASRAGQAQAEIDANLARARAEDARRARDAQRKCSGCQTAFLNCTGTGGSEAACTRQFQQCRESLDLYLAEQTTGPCRRP